MLNQKYLMILKKLKMSDNKGKISDACTSHCCVYHGCKYNDEDCTVLSFKGEQEHTCPYCHDDDEYGYPEFGKAIFPVLKSKEDVEQEIKNLDDTLKGMFGENGLTEQYFPSFFVQSKMKKLMKEIQETKSLLEERLKNCK